MKKVLALILAVVMCFGMASVAFGIDVTLPMPGCVTVGSLRRGWSGTSAWKVRMPSG